MSRPCAKAIGAALLLVASAGGVSPAWGQAEVYLEVRKSDLFRTPIVIEDFVSALGEDMAGAVGVSTGILAGNERAEEVLARDLLYSDAFIVIREAPGDTAGSLHVDIQGRPVERAVRARLQGRLTGRRDSPRLEAVLVDGSSHERILERRYDTVPIGLSAALDPWQIHRLADEIAFYLTGTPGCAATCIAFVRTEPNGSKELHLIDWDGHGDQALTSLGSILLSPGWDPAGSRLAFTSYRQGQPRLVSLRLADGRLTTLWSGATPGAPAYSPDGKQIAFSATDEGNAEIYAARADGSQARRLTLHPGIDTSPSWAPSGERLVFTSDRCGKPQLFIMDADGANLAQITFTGDWNDSPDWSPQGNRIVHVSLIEKRFELALIRADGTGWQRLTKGGGCENPSWAPDGRHVVFARSLGGLRNLWVLDVDSGSLRQLTSSASQSYNPAWSPATRERIRASGHAE